MLPGPAMANLAGALADGMPRGNAKAFDPPPFSWTGFYIGGHAGLANGTIAQGWIQLTGGGDEYQVAYWAQVAP